MEISFDSCCTKEDIDLFLWTKKKKNEISSCEGSIRVYFTCFLYLQFLYKSLQFFFIETCNSRHSLTLHDLRHSPLTVKRLVYLLPSSPGLPWKTSVLSPPHDISHFPLLLSSALPLSLSTLWPSPPSSFSYTHIFLPHTHTHHTKSQTDIISSLFFSSEFSGSMLLTHFFPSSVSSFFSHLFAIYFSIDAVYRQMYAVRPSHERPCTSRHWTVVGPSSYLEGVIATDLWTADGEGQLLCDWDPEDRDSQLC